MNGSNDIPLELLIARCKQNDRNAQEVLYRHFYHSMMPVCMGYAKQPDDAVDIYNRSFLKIFTKLGDFHGDGAFEGWVRKTIINTAIDYLRREEKSRKNIDIDEVSYISSADNPMSHILSEDIIRIMQQLPPIQRLVVNLYLIEGYNHNEIAKKLNIRPGTSKWHLSEGRKRLKVILTKTGITN